MQLPSRIVPTVPTSKLLTRLSITLRPPLLLFLLSATLIISLFPFPFYFISHSGCISWPLLGISDFLQCWRSRCLQKSRSLPQHGLCNIHYHHGSRDHGLYPLCLSYYSPYLLPRRFHRPQHINRFQGGCRSSQPRPDWTGGQTFTTDQFTYCKGRAGEEGPGLQSISEATLFLALRRCRPYLPWKCRNRHRACTIG